LGRLGDYYAPTPFYLCCISWRSLVGRFPDVRIAPDHLQHRQSSRVRPSAPLFLVVGTLVFCARTPYHALRYVMSLSRRRVHKLVAIRDFTPLIKKSIKEVFTTLLITGGETRGRREVYSMWDCYVTWGKVLRELWRSACARRHANSASRKASAARVQRHSLRAADRLFGLLRAECRDALRRRGDSVCRDTPRHHNHRRHL
jgi:hypothetical protein